MAGAVLSAVAALRCPRCVRPAALCWCTRLAPVTTATRVVFLQHPRERRVAIGTGRLAHHALANSELHRGVRFAGAPGIETLLRPHARAAVLFPGGGARLLDTFVERPATLVVVDGTWTQARALLARNPAIAALPRIDLAPVRPSRYRVRKAPAAHCLSTVEAVVEALSRLEGGRERFEPVLAAFEDLVAVQIACAAARPRPYTHIRRRRRRGRYLAVPAAVPGVLYAADQ